MDPDPATVLSIDTPAFADLAADLFARGASVRFRARGHSMRPTIRDGDVVTVAPPARRRRGAVLLYRSPGGRLLVHRLLGRRRDGTLLLRGDAAGHAPETAAPHEVLGRVVAVQRDGRPHRLDTLPSRLAGLARALHNRGRRHERGQ